MRWTQRGARGLAHRVGGGLVIAALVGACSRPGAVFPATRAPESAATTSMTTQGPGVTAEPITYAPDNMWAFLASMPGLQRRSDSLAEATRFADVVVVGQFVGVERGGQYGSDATAVALIDVQTVAKGAPVLAADGRLRVEFVLVVGSQTYPEKELADLRRSIPTDPALLYLFTWASFFELTGDKVKGWSDRADLATVYKTIGGDGALRIVGGRVEPPPYVDGWAAEQAGRPLSEVLSEVSAAAGG